MYIELFNGQNFHEAAQLRKEALLRDIHGYEMTKILQTSLEDLAAYFEDKYKMNAPQLKMDGIYLPESPKEESRIERVPDRIWEGEYVNVSRNYINFTVCIPFDGDPNLFNLIPSTRLHVTGRRLNAAVYDSEIKIIYNEQIENPDQVDKIYQPDIDVIETNTKRLCGEVERFNNELPSLISQKIAERKQTAEKSQSIIHAFKIPIKKRDDVPATYSIPDIQKKPQILENRKVSAFVPEPTLAIGEYENIITIIKDMALAMERSPKTFSSLSEEEIRNFFIILLNGHYQGSATGETFNGSGKTDILIRYQGINAFIGECKFWKGEKKMSEAIDQLLGYVTWRDTKTALIIFSKQKDLSSVLEKARNTIKEHKKYKSESSFNLSNLNNSETVWGYKFLHPSDSGKEIFLTLMAFQIDEPAQD